MHATRHACLLALLLIGTAQAQQPLSLTPQSAGSGLGSMWQRSSERVTQFQFGESRFDLSLAEFNGGPQRARLFGDYYLTGPGFGAGQVSGGLRLTSGLAFGPAAAAEGSYWQLPSAGAAGHDRALPYLGVGYTGLSARAGWGFTADIGLGGLRPGEQFRFGRSGPSAAQVENVLNDLRLAPVLQLGVSYAF
jgi:hypothetical protein